MSIPLRQQLASPLLRHARGGAEVVFCRAPARGAFAVAFCMMLLGCASEGPSLPSTLAVGFTPVAIISQRMQARPVANAGAAVAQGGAAEDRRPTRGQAGGRRARQRAPASTEESSASFQRIRDAVLMHPELGAAEQRIEAAVAAIESARSSMGPRVQIGGDAGRYQTSRDTGPRNNAFALARQVLFDGGRTYHQAASAEARLRQSAEERLAAATNLAMRAVEAHFNVRDARALETLAETDKNEHERLLAMIESRVEGRVAAESDALLGRSRVADAASRLTRARARARETEAIYAEVYGLPPGRLDALPRIQAAADEQARQKVLDNPRLTALDANIEALVAGMNAARAGRLPRLSIEVTNRRYDRRYERSGRDEVYGGFVVDHDLYAGGAVEASIREAVARLSEARYRRDTLGRELRRALDLAISDRIAGDSSVAAATMATAANAAALAAMREQFVIGRRAVRELLDAQRDRIAAEVSLIQARTSRAMADYTIMALTDDLLSQVGINPETLRGPASPAWRWP